MSWSLRLQNGDFVPSGGSYALAQNETKLVQDLRCWILEELGDDPFHPTYGSKINGDEVIGQQTQFAVIELEGEIRRIVTELQKQQIARARREQLTQGKVTLSRGEVLISLSGIELVQNQDRLSAKLSLITGDENYFTFEIPLDANTA